MRLHALSLRAGRLGLLACLAFTALPQSALGETATTITFAYPDLPPINDPDDDGILNVASHTFQEAGMHVESFWVPNDALVFTQGHFHIHFPNQFLASHGGRTVAGLGPDRQGMYLRREDGGPFDLNSLDYRLIQPAATSILIGTSFDPALPATAQLTAFPVVADAGFQTLLPAGFTGVTELFIAWDLTETNSDAGHIDNIVTTIPSGTCSPSQPGGVVASHAGLTDPVAEGWTADGPGTGVSVGPIAGDFGYDSFYVDDDSAASDGWRSYVRNLSPDEMCWARTAGFTLRSRVRVANTPDFTDGSVTMSFFDSLELFELRLGSNGSNDPIASVSGSSVTLTGLGAGYHLYELVYDPLTKTVDLLVDGVEQLSNRPGVPIVVQSPRVAFGSPIGGANGMGEGRYALVEFELPPACANGVDDDGDGQTDFPADIGCDDAMDDSEQSLSLVCDDGADNDGDLAIDFPADAGCVDSADASETTACENAADDDGDGLIDLADPGCADANDDSELSPGLVCDDGLDNDSDLAIDFPADTGCASLLDPTETSACDNASDDDGDGALDFPADPGCTDANDDSEKSLSLVCDDGLDNDGDLAIDFPADPGCFALADPSETTACSDAADNDGDGLADLADPGCANAIDDSEKSVSLVCDDGLDNDGDLAIDFPADSGCTALADTSETTACNDAVDNDGDGLSDLADPGCADANDDSEKSVSLVCDDGADNDGDLASDFPADSGCNTVHDASEAELCNTTNPSCTAVAVPASSPAGRAALALALAAAGGIGSALGSRRRRPTRAL